jgi:hypothetical protein
MWSVGPGLLHGRMKSGRRQLRLAARLALGVQRRLEEGHGGDAGDLDRVLEGKEQACDGALVRLHVEQVLAVEQHFATGDLVVFLAGEHIAQRRLARAVAPHDGVHLALGNNEVHALEDFALFDADAQVADFEHWGGHSSSPISSPSQ